MSPSSTYPLSLHDALPIFRNDDDPAADFEAQKAFTPWSSLWNLTGAPAISLPLHWASVEDDGPELPFGVLIGAGVGQEKTLLAVSSALEEALPWHTRKTRIALGGSVRITRTAVVIAAAFTIVIAG